MTDLHTHILPGLDDGAGSPEESLEMARIAVADGIRRVIATPHSYGERGFYEELPKDILQGVETFRSMLARENIPLQVAPGMEVLLSPETLEYARRGWLLPLGGSDCLLCEFAGEDGATMTELLKQVAACGYRPLIAHAERYAPFWKSSSLAEEFVSRGWRIQVNAAHLTDLPEGLFVRRQPRWKMIRTAWHLVEEGLCFAVASDAHSAKGRVPILSKAKKQIAQRVDPTVAYMLCRENPTELIK